MHPKYSEWLSFVFDRQPTPSGWYFDIEDVDFDVPTSDVAELVALTFENCGRDLARYDDRQVAEGVNYIVNNSCSNVVYALFDETVGVELRLRAIHAIKTLYRDCFTPRCAPVLGHSSQPGANPLTYPCYMLWDIFPFSIWNDRKDGRLFYETSIEVMTDALDSPNPACIESALHGLGHFILYWEEAADVVQQYLKRKHHVLPGLKSYAERALTGNVQ